MGTGYKYKYFIVSCISVHQVGIHRIATGFYVVHKLCASDTQIIKLPQNKVSGHSSLLHVYKIDNVNKNA